jgi:hypothetical protein
MQENLREVSLKFYVRLGKESIVDALFEYAKDLQELKGWFCVPFRIEKEGKKYIKKPLGRWSELRDGKVDLKTYWKSLPAKDELTVSGIGVICGEQSGVTVIDVDDPKKFEDFTGLKIEDLIKKTLAVKTINGGYHFYFKYEGDIPTKTFPSYGFDTRNDNSLAVLPPSFVFEEPPAEVIKALGLEAEINGPKYEWLNDLEPAPIPEALKNFIARTRLETKKEEKVSNLPLKKLPSEVVSQIAELFVPVWKPGYRNSFTIFLLGLLYKAGIDQESAKQIIDRITTLAGDEEKKQRLAQVRYQYEIYLPKKGKENIKGWKGITELLEDLKKEGVINEEGINYFLSELQILLGYDKEAIKNSKIFVRTGFNPIRGFVNDTKNCWIASWVETKDSWKLKNIYFFTAIKKLTVNYDPFRNTKIYTATFVKQIGESTTSFTLEGTLDEIYAQLKAEALAVRRDAKEVLASLFSQFEKKKLANTETKPLLRGFILRDGKLVLNNHKLPEPDPIKVKEALLVLNEYIEKYAGKKKKETVTVLKWALVSPFNWIKKQIGKKDVFKWLFLIGSPDTGKTTDAELFTRWLWNLEENSTSAASLKTPSRLGKKANAWTFPWVVNEASSLFTERGSTNEEIREMLRQIWDGTIAREVRKQTGEKIVELAGATFIFTANRAPHLYPADAKRILVVKYNPSARVTQTEKFLFEYNFTIKKKELLKYIGAAVFKWAKENIDKILEGDDINLIGNLILEDLYTEYVGEIPNWIGEYIDEETEGEEELPTREDILTFLIKHINQILLPLLGHSISHGKIPIAKRLLLAKNIDPSLPYEVDIENSFVYFKKGILKLLKEEFEIASLKDLEAITGGEYKRVHKENLHLKGNKVVAIPLDWFNEFEAEPISSLKKGILLTQEEAYSSPSNISDIEELDLDFNLENDGPPKES